MLRARDIMRAVPTVRPELTHAVARQLLQEHAEALVLPVLDGQGRATHLIERSALLESLAGRFGFSLLNHRPLAASLALKLICLPLRRCHHDASLDQLADQLRGEGSARVPAVVIEDHEGSYQGVVAQEDLLDGLLRQSREQTEALSIAAARAEQANRSKAAFLANMSHELRTPMTAIIGFSEAAYELASDEFQRDFLQTVLSAGKHLTSLLDDVLDLARIEGGRLAVNHAPFPLRDTILATCTMLEPVIRRRGLDFVIDLHADLPAIACGDPLRLRQIITNLLANAAKFTTQGEVRLRAGPKGSDGFLVEISDTGVGIAAEDLPRLFRPFSQLAAGERAGGSGLGLAITKHLCELKGGSIVCRSEPGQGSTFSCLLPAAPAQQLTMPTPLPGPGPASPDRQAPAGGAAPAA